MRRFLSLLSLCLVAALLVPDMSHAQLGKRLKRRAKRKAEQRVEHEADRQMDSVLDQAENAVRCSVGDSECIEKAKEEGRDVSIVDEDGNEVEFQKAPESASAETPGPPDGGEASLKPGEGVWANYDFIPGDRVLFAEDFEEERVGNFPRRLEFIQGNMEVVEWEGSRLLRGSDDLNRFAVALTEPLPDRFTIEFDFFREGKDYAGLFVLFEEKDLDRPWLYPDWAKNAYEASQFTVGPKTGLTGPRESLGDGSRVTESVTPIRIHVDGSYAKMYVDETRVSNVPNAEIRKGDKVYFYFTGYQGVPAYIGNIRIAAGGGALYDALEANGEVTTKGILFQSGSASIRPESTPTLDEIGRMLNNHADLSLLIEGHTDSVGDDSSNQNLSERRAAAVRSYLIETYGVDPGRLQSAGLGESQPVDSNDTAEGRQNNRRVVLKKLL